MGIHLAMFIVPLYIYGGSILRQEVSIECRVAISSSRLKFLWFHNSRGKKAFLSQMNHPELSTWVLSTPGAKRTKVTHT